MSTNPYAAEYLRTSTDIHVSLDVGASSLPAAHAYRYLLKQEAIGTNLRAGMNDESIRMGDEKTTFYGTVEWDICPSDDAPQSIL